MRISDVVVGAGDRSHDLVISSCGYERRSSYLCRLGVAGALSVALTYGSESESFEENIREFEKRNWILRRSEDVGQVLEILATAGPSQRILVDISSMPRTVLAVIVQLLAAAVREHETTFVYAPGKFEQSADAARRQELLTAEPVSSFFAGELRPTSVPVGLVVGLGLEPHRALGIMELLEPAQTWIFTTYSGDERFKDAAEQVHKRLLETFDPTCVFEYELRSIAQTFSSLESLVFSSALRYRLILAPSGPKVFTLACLLVGAARDSVRPAVWRVGGAGDPHPYDVDESGELICARVNF